MITALSTIFVFFLVVVSHEFGHFITAKMSGIKVNEFAIGMGPKLFKIKKGETDYTLRLLPIGGYCKMEGEDENSEDDGSFSKKPIGSRMIVIAAGAIMNFILAIVIFTIYAFNVGTPTTIIKSADINLPAYTAGLRSGDKVISINGEEINDWGELQEEISQSQDSKIKVTVLRNDRELTFEISPIFEESGKRMIIGISPEMEKSLLTSIKDGVSNVIYILGLMIDFILKIFRGEISGADVSGPVGIVYLVGQASKSGFLYVLYIAGFISINLGFFNLLPIPALDGSRLVFLFIELLRGKPISPEKEGYVHFVGLIFLLLLTVVVAYNDILRFNIFRW